MFDLKSTFFIVKFFIQLIGNQNSTFQLIQANLNWLKTAEKGWNFWLWVGYIQIISYSVKQEVEFFGAFHGNLLKRLWKGLIILTQVSAFLFSQ